MVATVSAIYGLGTPQEYVDRMVRLRVGEEIDRDGCCAGWSASSTPATTWPAPAGTFRVRGDTLEVFPMYEELAVRVEFFGDEIERLSAPCTR